ncbi:MAG: response regulator, partial [Candidatus Omnitrophota bacterium]
MDKQMLLVAARKLQSVSSDVMAEYETSREEMVSRINARMAQRGDLFELIGGQGNLAVMENNHANHALFMRSIWSAYDADTFVETVIWVYRTYRARGFRPEYWVAQLNLWLEILQKRLSEKSYTAIKPFYNFVVTHHDFFTAISATPEADNATSRHEGGSGDQTTIRHGTRILVIDDDVQVHDIFLLRLKKDGYLIDYVFSGEEALPLVKSVNYDLIFVDMVMPGIDGVETCKAIKEIDPEAVLICMTGVFGKKSILSE